MAYPELTDQEKLFAGNVTNIKFGEIRKNHFRKKRNERAGFV